MQPQPHGGTSLHAAVFIGGWEVGGNYSCLGKNGYGAPELTPWYLMRISEKKNSGALTNRT